MKTKKISKIKLAFLESKKRFVIVSLPLSFFALISICMLVLGFFFPITLFLTVPFLVIPSFFSVSAICSLALNKNTHEGLGFFIMFRAYFSEFFKGGYRVVISFLKALLAFIVASLVLSIILANTILYKDAGFIAFQQSIEPITDANQLLEMTNNFIATNKAFNLVLFIVNSCGFLVGFYVFMHEFAVNSIKYNYNFVARMPLPTQDLNVITKTVLKQNRSKFYKIYYKMFWFLGLLLIGGYAAGTLLSYFFIPSLDVSQVSIVGMFGSFILLLFFIPYFLCASEVLFADYRSKFVEVLIDLSKQSLEELKKTKTISEEKEKEVLKFIESQKEEDKDKESKDSE